MKTITKFTMALLFLFIGNTGFSQYWQPYDDWEQYAGAAFGYPIDAFSEWANRINDRHIVGDFNGDGNDELFFINRPKSYMYKMIPTVGTSRIYYKTDGKINNWICNADDKYISGYFMNTLGACDLLIISNSTRKVSLQSFNASTNSFYERWTNNGNGYIGGWYIQDGDKFIVGDFNGDSKEDLLCLSVNGWAILQTFNGSTWNNIWHNNGNNRIGGVIGGIKVNDNTNGGLANHIHIFGSFMTKAAFGPVLQSDQRKELFTIIGKWATILKYNPNINDWDWIWSQNGANDFGGWSLPMQSKGLVVSGNFYDHIDYYGNYSEDEFLFLQTGNTIPNRPAMLIGHGMYGFSCWWFNENNSKISYYTGIGGDAFNNYSAFSPKLLRINGNNYLLSIKIGYTPTTLNTRYDLLKYTIGNYYSPLNLKSLNVKKEKDMEQLISYTLFPNPSQDFINIQRTLSDNSSHYQIYDMLGKKLKDGTIAEGEYNQRIDLSGFKAGTYTIRLQDGNKTITEKILVK